MVAPRTRMADIVFDTLRRNLVFIDKILGDLVAVFHFIHDQHKFIMPQQIGDFAAVFKELAKQSHAIIDIFDITFNIQSAQNDI